MQSAGAGQVQEVVSTTSWIAFVDCRLPGPSARAQRSADRRDRKSKRHFAILAVIALSEPVDAILRHLGLPATPPPPSRVAGITGGADAAALAGEGDQEVGTEVSLHPARHALAVGIRLGGFSQDGLEGVLDDGVERRGRGVAAPVDGGEAIRSRGT